MEIPHNVHELVLYVIGSAICIIMSYGVAVLKGMKDSVEKLNMKMVQMFERTKWHEREISRLDKQKADRKSQA